ncbi:MAG: flotillin family protein [Lachnospiraceae bacterium]|nr:flotillin family protein [Lachnospiraceae bacterium]
MPETVGTLICVIAVVLLIFIALLAVIIASGYVKAPPDTAYIISGFKKEPKVLIGRAGIKLPFLERKDMLLVKQMSIDIKTNGYIPTLDFIGVDIDAIAKVRIMTDDKGIKLAMKNFLNMNEKQIAEALTDSLQGNMREIIGTVSLKELCNDRKKFGDEVQTKAQIDMNNLGIEIISCNIQRIEDKNDLINALGQDNMSQIQKSASIARAQAEKDVAIEQAKAKQLANEANVNAETDIAERNNQLAIKQAELKREADIKKAEADAAYRIQEEEQRKSIEVASANADIAKQEREIELKQKEASVKEQELAATIRKKADADKYEAQQMADVELYRKQQEAEAMRAQADAAKYAAEQEAEAIRVKGIAEAEAIRAKAIAEAEGIEKKALAQAKMKEASILEMYFSVLPQIAENVAKPLASVDKITMYGEGNSAKMVSDIVNSTTQISEGLTQGLGIDIKTLLSGALGGVAYSAATNATAKAKADESKDVKEDNFKEVETEE